MITASEIYWVTRLDGICFVLGMFSVIFCIAFIVWVAYEAMENDRFSFMSLIPAAFFVFFMIATVMTPTTKQYVAMVLLPKIANNEQVQRIPGAAIDLLEAQMKAWIEDLKK